MKQNPSASVACLKVILLRPIRSDFLLQNGHGINSASLSLAANLA